MTNKKVICHGRGISVTYDFFVFEAVTDAYEQIFEL